MKHKDKLTLARRMTGKAKNVFTSVIWKKRKEQIKKRVLKREEKRKIK